MDRFAEIISKLAENFWNIYTISLLLGTGFILTFATRFIQIRRFTLGWKLILMGALRKDQSQKETGDISPFQALMTSLSATVGLGNIAGVATAIVYGGPGGIFWMWMTAIVGMATKYSEAILAVHFRKIAEDGSMSGGPMYYIRRGFEHIKFLKPFAIPLAGIFAVCGAWTALFGTGNMMQANQIAQALKEQFYIPYLVSGAVIAILTALVIIGGIKRIGATTEILVPFMIGFYFFGGIIILLINIVKLPAVFVLIFKCAFAPQAAIGGFAGHMVKEAVAMGVRRGILSNESGLGSTPIAHAASKTKNPVRQGLIAMFDTFIDTIIVCTLTALVILVTGAYKPESSGGVQLTMAPLTQHAFSMQFGIFGKLIVTFGAFLFGYSTLIGWYYYGERCFEYLFGLKAITSYKIIYVTLTFIGGAILQSGEGAFFKGEFIKKLVWNIGDFSNGLMALPNLVGLLCLTGVVYKITKEYDDISKVI